VRFSYEGQEMQCTRKRNIEALSLNHCFRAKAVSTAYSEIVFVALFIQNAKRMRRIILSTVACPLYQIFLHYLTNVAIIRKTVSVRKISVVFTTTFVPNFSHSKTNSARYSQKCN
jgi:hypothetical protein